MSSAPSYPSRRRSKERGSESAVGGGISQSYGVASSSAPAPGPAGAPSNKNDNNPASAKQRLADACKFGNVNIVRIMLDEISESMGAQEYAVL